MEMREEEMMANRAEGAQIKPLSIGIMDQQQ